VSDREPFDEDDREVVRHEEEVEVGRIEREVGRVRLRKVVEERPFEDIVPRGIEHADVERVAADEHDDGDVRQLPDGSVSIPVFEEQLVVEKRLVVRERVLVRKRVESTPEHIGADLRREVVEVEVDPETADRVHVEGELPGQ
jgi:stress response protein YsnF